MRKCLEKERINNDADLGVPTKSDVKSSNSEKGLRKGEKEGR